MHGHDIAFVLDIVSDVVRGVGGCITCRGGHGYFLEAHITVLTNCGFTSTDFVKMVMSG